MPKIVIAFIPSSGLKPAWADLPNISIVNEIIDGASIAHLPNFPSKSSTYALLDFILLKSKYLLPWQYGSSAIVIKSSMSLCAKPFSFIVLKASIIDATPAISSAPKTVFPSVFIIPSDIILFFPIPGETVSRWEEKSIESSKLPLRYAYILPLEWFSKLFSLANI